MPNLTFDALPQHVLEYAPGKQVHGGGSFDVSDEAALALLTDPQIPILGGAEQLAKLSRAKLDVVASGQGLDPSEFSTKEAVADAIVGSDAVPDHSPSPLQED